MVWSRKVSRVTSYMASMASLASRTWPAQSWMKMASLRPLKRVRRFSSERRKLSRVSSSWATRASSSG